MTRESAKSKVNRHQIDILNKADGVIDQIYNDHEAQLKAKESDLERQDMIIKCLNIDLDNKEKLLKAKNEEIERLEALVDEANKFEEAHVKE